MIRSLIAVLAVLATAGIALTQAPPSRKMTSKGVGTTVQGTRGGTKTPGKAERISENKISTKWDAFTGANGAPKTSTSFDKLVFTKIDTKIDKTVELKNRLTGRPIKGTPLPRR